MGAFQGAFAGGTEGAYAAQGRANVSTTQSVKHAPPQQLVLRETPKGSVHISSAFEIYDKYLIGWPTFYHVYHII
jgi:hypothetical protein